MQCRHFDGWAADAAVVDVVACGDCGGCGYGPDGSLIDIAWRVWFCSWPCPRQFQTTSGCRGILAGIADWNPVDRFGFYKSVLSFRPLFQQSGRAPWHAQPQLENEHSLGVRRVDFRGRKECHERQVWPRCWRAWNHSTIESHWVVPPAVHPWLPLNWKVVSRWRFPSMQMSVWQSCGDVELMLQPGAMRLGCATKPGRVGIFVGSFSLFLPRWQKLVQIRTAGETVMSRNEIIKSILLQ